MGCARNKEARGCANGRRVNIDELERQALDGLRSHLLTPEALSTFVDEYHRLMRTDRAAQQRDKRSRDRMIAERKMQIDRVVNAIAEGTDSPGLRAKLVKLEGELAELSFRREDEAAIVNLAPDLPAFYRKQVEALTELVKAPELLPRAVAILRDLLDRLVLRPTEARGEFELELQGHLAGLLRFAGGKPAGRSAPVLERGLLLAERGGVGCTPHSSYCDYQTSAPTTIVPIRAWLTSVAGQYDQFTHHRRKVGATLE